MLLTGIGLQIRQPIEAYASYIVKVFFADQSGESSFCGKAFVSEVKWFSRKIVTSIFYLIGPLKSQYKE